MPNFSNPLTGLNIDRTLTKEELIRAVRFMIAAEYEAIEMYGKVQDATPDEKIKKGIQSITDEEKIHAGEFLKMLEYLDPKEKKFYQEGAKEVEDFLKMAAYKGTQEYEKLIKKFDNIKTEADFKEFKDLIKPGTKEYSEWTKMSPKEKKFLNILIDGREKYFENPPNQSLRDLWKDFRKENSTLSKITKALDSVAEIMEVNHPGMALTLDKIADSIDAQSSTCNFMLVELDIQKIEKSLKNIESWIPDMSPEISEKIKSNLYTANKSIEEIKKQLKKSKDV
jgi:rubrerythrin